MGLEARLEGLIETVVVKVVARLGDVSRRGGGRSLQVGPGGFLEWC